MQLQTRSLKTTPGVTPGAQEEAEVPGGALPTLGSEPSAQAGMRHTLLLMCKEGIDNHLSMSQTHCGEQKPEQGADTHPGAGGTSLVLAGCPWMAPGATPGFICTRAGSVHV